MNLYDYTLWKYTGCTCERRRLRNWVHFNVNTEAQHMIGIKLQTETMRQNIQRIREQHADHAKPAS